MDIKNKCIICGLKTKELTNKMCTVCDHLANEKFYEIKTEFLARGYFRDYLLKDPNKTIAEPPVTQVVKNAEGKDETKTIKQAKTASDMLHEQYTKFPTTEWIHGIMPSKCPFCLNLSTNRGIFQRIKRGSPQYKSIIEKGEMPKLVCKACGDLTLYLNHIYSFSKQQSVETMKFVGKIRKQIKEEKLVCCQVCADGLGPKEDYEKIKRTENQEKLMKFHVKKFLCKSCLENLENEAKNTIPKNK